MKKENVTPDSKRETEKKIFIRKIVKHMIVIFFFFIIILLYFFFFYYGLEILRRSFYQKLSKEIQKKRDRYRYRQKERRGRGNEKDVLGEINRKFSHKTTFNCV